MYRLGGTLPKDARLKIPYFFGKVAAIRLMDEVESMHEMAIAEGILDIALDYAKQNDAQKINEIGLLIGEMSGVEVDSLEFSFNMLVQGTMAEGAKLVIKNVPLMGRCSKCGKEFHIEHYDFWCPECKDGVLTTLSGREMQVEYLEVD